MTSYSKATKKELRNTGLVVGGAFLVLGVVMLFKHGRVPPPIMFAIGGVLVLLGLLAPALLRPFHFVWMKFAEGMGWVMNRVILGILFFIFLSPGAVLIRLFGRDLLKRHFNQRAESYWVGKPEPVGGAERYERQF